jgi:hypothetical protein
MNKKWIFQTQIYSLGSKNNLLKINKNHLKLLKFIFLLKRLFLLIMYKISHSVTFRILNPKETNVQCRTWCIKKKKNKYVKKGQVLPTKLYVVLILFF